jgi:hypothetical protein
MLSLARTTANVMLLAVLLLALGNAAISADNELRGRSSGKVIVKATSTKVSTKFEVKKDEWIELEVQGQWRMSEKQEYTGMLGHIRLNKINNLGYLGSLIVQIGTGPPFALTEELPFQAPASGIVQFWPNRQGFTTWKADGELTVVIRAGEHLKEKRATQPDPELPRTLALINEARKAAGLEEAKLSKELSLGCQKHSRYLVVNAGNPLVAGMKAHEEHKQLKEYSEEGAKSAKLAVIHSLPPSIATREWLASFYHRVPLLDPSLKEIGIGYAQQNGEWACAVDCLTGAYGKRPKDVVYFPEDGQANVPLKFGIELPSALPADHKGDAGFPITIQFAHGQKVTKVEFKLTGPKDASVPVYLSTPEAPATSFTQRNTICAIPRQPLTRATSYTAELRCFVEEKPFSRTWRFSTEK